MTTTKNTKTLERITNHGGGRWTVRVRNEDGSIGPDVIRNMKTRTKIEAGLKLNIIGEGTTVEVASVTDGLVTFTNGNFQDIGWMECRIGTDSADPVYTVNSYLDAETSARAEDHGRRIRKDLYGRK